MDDQDARGAPAAARARGEHDNRTETQTDAQTDDRDTRAHYGPPERRNGIGSDHTSTSESLSLAVTSFNFVASLISLK